MATLLTKVRRFERPWSLRGRLLRILLITLSGVSLIYAGLVFLAILHQGQRNADRALQRSAELLLEFIEDRYRHSPADALGPLGEQDRDLPATRIWLWDNQGRALIGASAAPLLHGAGAPKFQDFTDDGGRWHVVTVWNESHTLELQVAGPLREATQGAGQLASLMVLALVLSLPGAGLLVWGAVARAVSPVPLAAAQVALRGPDDLREIPAEALPLELAPLVTAFNQLLGRVATALAQERLFAANAAHELRTPLAAIRINAQLAQRGPEAVSRPALEKLITNVDRMTRLIEQLLTLARLESGALARQGAERFRLDRLVDETLVELEGLRRARTIQVHRQVDAVVVDAPFQASYMLLRNLIENALRYTSEGSGEVTVRAHADGEGWHLAVWDNGPGISAAQVDLLLGNARAQRRIDASGTGLGLAIVRRVADLLQAEITIGVDSEGIGTRLDVHVRAPNALLAAQPIAQALPIG